jgi:hypothetical protein
MLPENMVMPAAKRLAARVLFGAAEEVRRRAREWTI